MLATFAIYSVIKKYVFQCKLGFDWNRNMSFYSMAFTDDNPAVIYNNDILSISRITSNIDNKETI